MVNNCRHKKYGRASPRLVSRELQTLIPTDYRIKAHESIEKNCSLTYAVNKPLISNTNFYTLSPKYLTLKCFSMN